MIGDCSGDTAFLVEGKRKLKLVASKLAHLDSIRKVEWIQKDNQLYILTFSEDGLIKTWRVEAGEEGLMLVNNPKSQSALKNNCLPRSEDPFDTQNLMTQKNSDLQGSYRQQSRAFPVFNGPSSGLESKKRFFNLKKEAVLHFHVAPIFSSCFETKENGVIRVFSGDSKGNIHGFNFSNHRLTHTNSIRAGSEPCWALAQVNQNLLAASSPNKLRLFHSDSQSEKTREEFSYSNNNSIFGQLRCLNNNSIVVNCFSRETIKNDFCVFDLFKTKESSRINSDRLFSNSFVVSQSTGLLYSANEDKTVSLHDLRCKQQANHFYAHSGSVVSIDLSFDKNIFVTAGTDSSIRIWDLRNLRICDETKAHLTKNEESIFEVKFDPLSRFVASSGADGGLKIFRI